MTWCPLVYGGTSPKSHSRSSSSSSHDSFHTAETSTDSFHTADTSPDSFHTAESSRRSSKSSVKNPTSPEQKAQKKSVRFKSTVDVREAQGIPQEHYSDLPAREEKASHEYYRAKRARREPDYSKASPDYRFKADEKPYLDRDTHLRDLKQQELKDKTEIDRMMNSEMKKDRRNQETSYDKQRALPPKKP